MCTLTNCAYKWKLSSFLVVMGGNDWHNMKRTREHLRWVIFGRRNLFDLYIFGPHLQWKIIYIQIIVKFQFRFEVRNHNLRSNAWTIFNAPWAEVEKHVAWSYGCQSWWFVNDKVPLRQRITRDWVSDTRASRHEAIQWRHEALCPESRARPTKGAKNGETNYIKFSRMRVWIPSQK